MFCEYNTTKKSRGEPFLKFLNVIISHIQRAGTYFGFRMTFSHNADQKSEGDPQQNMLVANISGIKEIASGCQNKKRHSQRYRKRNRSA